MTVSVCQGLGNVPGRWVFYIVSDHLTHKEAAVSLLTGIQRHFSGPLFFLPVTLPSGALIESLTHSRPVGSESLWEQDLLQVRTLSSSVVLIWQKDVGVAGRQATAAELT